MKSTIHFLFLLLAASFFICCIPTQTQPPNLALHLDGHDNYVAIGIGIIEGPWTLEAWIKGDDTHWKELEAIIGGGEYSELSYVDDIPLVIKNGKLHSAKADLWSPEVLDDQWHHVAVSCDGNSTFLYLDGKMVDSSESAYAVIPGMIGTQNERSTTFGGLIDEVRIWTDAIPEKVLQAWKGRPVQPSHPCFNNLKGYYTFDDGVEESSVNWVGKGHLAYHVRNYRSVPKEQLPLAYTVVNDNPAFKQPNQSQPLFNAVVIDSEWDVDQGKKDDQILKLRIAVNGSRKPVRLTELTLDLSETTDLADISWLHLYYTGNKARYKSSVALFEKGVTPEKRLILSAGKEIIELSPGINYILLTADISRDAKPGNTIKISVPSFKLNNKEYQPESADMLPKTVTENSRTNPNSLRVLQWNIWNAGIKLGEEGLNRITDLIKACDADIITMQEGYGSQHQIAGELNYQLQTPSPTDNLALFSRYEIEKQPSSMTFQSNPGKITLPNGRTILVNSCWLRYAYQPVYTGDFPEAGRDPGIWVAEDSIRPMADIAQILSKDVYPVVDSPDMPVILGGDFNSCSHLDWTAAAAPLHYGYGPVDFPTSRYMLEQGFIDSFRHINPDEVERPEGTFAIIYGQLQNSRIDYIYYKGKGIRAVTSKIIRTSPEIDFVWASDHDAVVTNFEVLPE